MKEQEPPKNKREMLRVREDLGMSCHGLMVSHRNRAFEKKAMLFGAKCESEIKEDKDRRVSTGFGNSEVVTEFVKAV